MLSRLLGKEFQRKRSLAASRPGPMRDYLSVPLVDKNITCMEAEIVALDLETTGLDPQQDHILSYGLVHVTSMSIQLSSARHAVIKIPEAIPESSAVIHGITDDESAAGIPLEQAVKDILQQLAGRIMLVHYASIEQNFLNSACQALYDSPFVIRTIDTLVLARRLFEMRNHTIQAGNLRLFNLRPEFNLPQYRAHNALSDALATAELFLAMAGEIYPKASYCRLERLLNE
jgi:DNA polymerase-3 subunit epsilon